MTKLSPIVGLLRIEPYPYPHLRDDGGCVLASDYEDERKTTFILEAVAAYASQAALIEQMGKALETADTALIENGLTGETLVVKMVRAALAASRKVS